MSTNLFDLNGKIALITGASRGIGESVARTLAAQGAHVIVSSRKLDGCELVASSIRSAGGSAEAFACHIGEMDQIDAVWEHIAQKAWQAGHSGEQRCYQPLFWAGRRHRYGRLQ